MTHNPHRVTTLAKTTYRNREQPFGIKRADRRFHLYALGATGSGKTTFLKSQICQDIVDGEGVVVLDPHGDLVEDVAEIARTYRPGGLIYFDAADPACPYGFNPMEGGQSGSKAFIASWLIDTFHMLWSESWGPRLEYILRYSLLTLIELPGATLGDLPRLLTDSAYRRMASGFLTDDQVAGFWREYEGYSSRFRSEAISPILNKVGAFLADETLRRRLTSPAKPLAIEQVMAEKKILLVNLSKGRMPSDSSSLLGALLLARIALAGLSRARLPENARPDTYVFLDECQNYATPGLAAMFSELRKYKVNLILAHQHLTQLAPGLRDAILGNVGTIAAFRTGVADARLLEPVFWPELRANDLISLPSYHMYIRLMVDGSVTKPFSAETLPPTM